MGCLHLVLLLLMCSTAWPAQAQVANPEQPPTKPAVAIVGAGMAGASAAYHLRGLDIELDVFEGSDVGGRAKGVTYKGQVLELGASIIWEHNILLAGIAKELGLKVHWLNPPSSPSNRTEAGSSTQGTDVEAGSGSGSSSSSSGSSSNDGGDDDDDAGESDGPFSIWDGTKFVFNQTGGWLDQARAALRYGPSPLLYGRHATQVWREHFKPIYDLQDKGIAFESVEELLLQTGLWNYTQQQCRQYMQHFLNRWWVWGADRFAEELAGAVNRVNYNQRSSTMNALAGLVSWLPAAGGGAWAVEGGNSQLASGMVNASHVRHLHAARVTSVNRTADGSFMLQVLQADTADSRSYGPYAAVILAAPLELSGIKLVGLGADGKAGASSFWGSPGVQADSGIVDDLAAGDGNQGQGDDSASSGGGGSSSSHMCLVQPDEVAAASHGMCAAGRAYQMTVTTFVTGGDLQPSAFGVQSLPAHTVFPTEGAMTDFSSISDRMVKGERVYKVFSQHSLSSDRISQLFGPEAQKLAVKTWWAYPRFSPPEQFAPFALAPGLCYTAALENSASAMEVAALAGRNCALLIAQQLRQPRTGAAHGSGAATSRDAAELAGDKQSPSTVSHLSVDDGLATAAAA